MSVNVATTSGVKNGTELVVMWREMRIGSTAGAPAPNAKSYFDRSIVVAIWRFPAVLMRRSSPRSANAALTRGSPKKSAFSAPMAPRTTCRGFFEEPSVHTTTVLTTETAKRTVTTMLIALRTPSPQ